MSRRPVGTHDRGAAAVEFALISMLLFPLLFAMVGFGLYLYGQQAAAHSAREAARLAAVGVTNCDDWRAVVADRSGIAEVDASTLSMVVQAGSDGVAGPGDTIVVSFEYVIPGGAQGLVNAASALLPGQPFGAPSERFDARAESRAEVVKVTSCAP